MPYWKNKKKIVASYADIMFESLFFMSVLVYAETVDYLILFIQQINF